MQAVSSWWNALTVASGAGLWAAVAVLVAGCSPAKPTNRPQTVPVKGRITLDGVPLARATVTFRPTGGGPGGSGITDDGGSYAISTFSPKDGAVPGTYGVAVMKMEPAPTGVAVDDPGYAPPTEAAKPPASVVPPRYADPTKSGLTAEVVVGRTEPFNFALKK